MDDPIDVEMVKEVRGLTMCTECMVLAEQRQRQSIAAHSRSSTKAVVITVVQEGTTIDHGVL